MECGFQLSGFHWLWLLAGGMSVEFSLVELQPGRSVVAATMVARAVVRSVIRMRDGFISVGVTVARLRGNTSDLVGGVNLSRLGWRL